MRTALPLLLLLGCYSQEEFVSDENAAICGWYERCDLIGTLGYDDAADCTAELNAWDEQEPPVCKGYDAGAASECVEGYALIDCEAEGTPTYPAACDDACAE